MREAGERMIDQGGGVFVGISSMAGITGVRGGASYSVSKCGVQMLTRVVAAEWGRYGIRANCIAPGPTASEGALRSWARGGMSPEQLGQRTPLKRVGTPRDIALAALFLDSDASGWVSGETLGVNGGPLMSGLPEDWATPAAVLLFDGQGASRFLARGQPGYPACRSLPRASMMRSQQPGRLRWHVVAFWCDGMAAYSNAFKYFAVSEGLRVTGKPVVQNGVGNVDAKPGDRAHGHW